jgi:hypothetical protein
MCPPDFLDFYEGVWDTGRLVVSADVDEKNHSPAMRKDSRYPILYDFPKSRYLNPDIFPTFFFCDETHLFKILQMKN